MRLLAAAALAAVVAAAGAVIVLSRPGDPPLRVWVRLPDFGDRSGVAPDVPRFFDGARGTAFEVGALHASAAGPPVRGWAEAWWVPWPGNEADLLEKPGAIDRLRERFDLPPASLRSWRMRRLDLVPTPPPGWSVWLRASEGFPLDAAPDPAAAGRWFEPDGRGGWDLVLELAADGTCTTSLRPDDHAAPVRTEGRWAVADDCLLVSSPPGGTSGGTDPVAGLLTAARDECWRVGRRPLRRRAR